MDYAEARAAFFQPRDGAPPADDATPGRRLRHALEPIATIHYWSEPASVAFGGIGLDFLGGYVWSRACVLGEPDAAVVAATFGVFEPGLIASVYDAARGVASLGQIRAARERGALESLRSCLGDADPATAATALRRGVGAADATGRPLFAGAAALSSPDPLTELWLAAGALREYRGDSHLAACVSHGLTGLEANLLTELHVGWEPQSYTATRGWSPEAMDAALDGLRERRLVAGTALTDAGTELRERVEEVTERTMAPVLTAIGDDLDAVVTACSGWSDAIIAAGWFPPDPYKRASG